LDIAPVGLIPTNNKQNRKSEKPKNKKKNFSKMFVINKKNSFQSYYLRNVWHGIPGPKKIKKTNVSETFVKEK
jgi:hypothetical protein